MKSIFCHPPFWILLYVILGIVSGALYGCLVNKDTRRQDDASKLGLKSDSIEEYGWTAGRCGILSLVILFWPIATAFLLVMMTAYFFFCSFTWYRWKKSFKAWVKGLWRALGRKVTRSKTKK